MNEMIDNVDVSGCEFYDNYECNCHISECWEPEDTGKMLCRQIDDCYYKQLQRTKQELNQDIEDIKQLKAENERLKTQYNCYACGNCKGKEDYINLEKHHKGLRKQFDKKAQTLQKIREIAEKVMLTELCNSCDGCGLIYGCNDIACAYYQMEKILQIITKAEEE